MKREWFGVTPDGRRVAGFTLTNATGMQVRFTEYGGIILSLRVPDRHGVPANVVHGFPTLDGYVNDTASVGAVIGRYANRIAGGRFTLGGKTYELARNERTSHLHGGLQGFNKKVWRGADDGTLRYESPAGEEGYPGALSARVRYTLSEDNSLACDFTATTDAPTHVNLTQHSYFNLSGDQRPVLDHLLRINARRFTPVDARLIPTGELRDVKGTPSDFTTPTPIGLRLGGAYDHNWVIDRDGVGLVQAATLHDPFTERTLELLTTQPGLQVYSGKPGAVALEPQHFPDTPNQPEFPTTLLSPGETYHARIVYRFRIGS
jgi:aldose 1-epimerase